MAWPSGLRRCVKAAVRKGVGSNPTAIKFFSIFWRLIILINFYPFLEIEISSLKRLRLSSLVRRRRMANLAEFTIALTQKDSERSGILEELAKLKVS